VWQKSVTEMISVIYVLFFIILSYNRTDVEST
jgi:hypothetical protein